VIFTLLKPVSARGALSFLTGRLKAPARKEGTFMKPLISIETVPISIEYTTTKPERGSSTKNQSAKLSVSKENDRVTIKSNPISIQLQDRFEPSAQRYMAYTATAEYSGSGTLRMNVRIQDGSDAPESNAYRFQAAGSGIDRMIDAVPKVQPLSSAPLTGMRINFDMARLSAEIPADSAETSFIPPDLELEVMEYPKVIIKYIGGPIYFPRSADPHYVPAGGSGFEAKA
jgi:hypothetical protein